MRTLATTLKTATRSLFGHSPRSEAVGARFASTAPELPPNRQPFTADDLAIGLDIHGTTVTLPPGHVLISGDPKTGVSSTVRTFAVHAAKFPGSRLHVYDATGEWVAMRLVAHRFITRAYGIADGLSDDTAAAQVVADLDALHTEMQRRTDHLRALNADLAAGNDTTVKRLSDLPALSLATLNAAGIDPARTDTETAGLHRHVVIIPDLAWWLTHEPHGTGYDILEKLFWLAGRGEAVGIHLVVAVGSRNLSAIPPVMRARIGTRIALRIANPAHADRIIGEAARLAGADASHAAHRPAPMLAWIVTPSAGGDQHRLAQLYRCSEMRLHRSLGWCQHDRSQRGWLTGDALTLHEETTAYHAGQHRPTRTDDGEGR